VKRISLLPHRNDWTEIERDAVIDGDDDLLGEIAARHGIDGESLTFAMALLALAVYDRDDLESFGDKLYNEVALAWAGR
jgi:hypothetical protein